MFTSPRTFRHLYAAITGILIGLAIWWVSSQIRPSEPVATQGITSVGTRGFRPVAAVTRRQWYLERVPNKDALDGYDLYVHEEEIQVDYDKHSTAWEKLVLMRYQNTATSTH